MPRLNLIGPSEATGKAGEILNGPLRAKQLNIFKGIANNPNVLEGFLGFMGSIKQNNTLSPAEQELVALVCAGLNNCEYCAAAHSKAAGGAGLSESALANALKGEAENDARQQAVVNFSKAMIEKKGFVSDAELDAFRGAGFGDDAVIEVVGLIAVNTFTNLFNHVNDTELDPIFQPAGAS